jgi:hypothetical protein
MSNVHVPGYSQPKIATETGPAPVVRGVLGICCPGCGEDGSLSVDVADLALSCRSCEWERSYADFVADLAGWTRLAAWLDAAPAVE